MLFSWTSPLLAGEQVIRYFPSGQIHDYRWKLLELVLTHSKGGNASFRLLPFAEDSTQDRGVSLLQSGAIDVIALGPNPHGKPACYPSGSIS